LNQFLPYLFFLSCPVSMGVMMWVMMRGMRGGSKDEAKTSDPRITQLEREVQALRSARQDRSADSVEMN